MKILQVKKYNKEIAFSKKEEARKKWIRNNQRGYYPVDSMFYFMTTDDKGHPKKRNNGYVAFEDDKAFFGMNKEKAIKKFKRSLNQSSN